MRRIFGIALELYDNSPLWAGALVFVLIGWTTFIALSLSSSAPKTADPYSFIVTMAREQLAGQVAVEDEELDVEMEIVNEPASPQTKIRIMTPGQAPESGIQMEYQTPTFQIQSAQPQAVVKPGQKSLDVMDE